MARASGAALAAGGSGARGWRRRWRAYLQGVWDELRKVVWPKRSELWRMTWVVVATVVVFGLLIGGADALFATMTSPLYNPGTPASSNSTTPATTTGPTTAPSPGASASPPVSAIPSPSSGAGASPTPTP